MKKNKPSKKIVVFVEKTEAGLSASAVKYAVHTTGENVPELITNIAEAINTYFGETERGRTITPNDLSLEINLTTIFQVFPINVKALSQRLGMNYTLLSQYTTGKKEPSPKQKQRILEGIHRIGKELSELNLI